MSVVSERFPRSAAYDPEWIRATVSGGAHSLWLTEWLASAMDLRPGMRVLDLGCGRGASSIFLHREFGVQVWGVDLWFDPAERMRRVAEAGAEGGVTVVSADARALPFAPGFFDAVVSIDSFFYYGTDDLYLNYLARYLRPGGQIGIAGAAVMHEVADGLPEHLRAWWTQDLWCLHSAAWWRTHWQKTGLVDVQMADTMPDGWQRWLDWHRVVAPDNHVEIAAVEADEGRYLGYARVVARRTDAEASEPVTTIVPEFTPARLRQEADSDERAVYALAARLADAERRQDADAIGELLTEDAVIMPPFVPAAIGRAACVALVRSAMEANAAEIERRSLVYDTTSLAIAGGVAVECGTYVHAFVWCASGLPQEERGQYLRVHVRRPGGSWLVQRIIWNLLPAGEAVS